jgi:hypothetical protein
MSAITAAMVGVILNLAVWFALQTLFVQTTVIRVGRSQYADLGCYWPERVSIWCLVSS